MTDDEHRDTSSLSERIRTYLESHPKRMDSLTGIVNWWWEFERYKDTSSAVEKALAQLVRNGVLKVLQVGGERLYSVSSSHQSLQGDSVK